MSRMADSRLFKTIHSTSLHSQTHRYQSSTRTEDGFNTIPAISTPSMSIPFSQPQPILVLLTPDHTFLPLISHSISHLCFHIPSLHHHPTHHSHHPTTLLRRSTANPLNTDVLSNHNLLVSFEGSLPFCFNAANEESFDTRTAPQTSHNTT